MLCSGRQRGCQEGQGWTKSLRNVQSDWSPALPGPTPDSGRGEGGHTFLIVVCTHPSDGPGAVLYVQKSFTPRALSTMRWSRPAKHTGSDSSSFSDSQSLLSQTLLCLSVLCENCQSSREGRAGWPKTSDAPPSPEILRIYICWALTICQALFWGLCIDEII